MAVSYFFIVLEGSDLTTYQAQHELVYPGNQVAAIPDGNGNLLVKVAYVDGTPKPAGALTFAEGKALIPVVDPLA